MMLAVLILMMFLTSCVTRTEVLTPTIPLPESPEYPENMQWVFLEEYQLYAIPREDMMRLANWRIDVEAYIKKVEELYSVFD
jgi:hypothetical protein